MDVWEETLNNSVVETKSLNNNNFNDYEINTQFKDFILHEKTGNNMRRKKI